FFTTAGKTIVGILIGAAILVLTGIWDDIKNRSPYIRFLVNCLVAILIIGFGIKIYYLTNPFDGVIYLNTWKINIHLLNNYSFLVWADLFTLFWIVWTTNITGWSGGVDGQLPGFVAVSAAVIGLLSLRYATNDPSQLQVTLLAFATCGAFLGFLPWNFYPQKIMPGYGGKTLAGFMLAVLSILSFSKLGTALLVLAVPMTDALFIFIKRIFSGKSPVWASSGHFHHHLLSLGWGKPKIAIFYWLISLLAGIPALTLNYKQKAFAGILLVVSVLILIYWINFLREFPKKTEGEQF
ncbi:undecaprenyl/decaprenyl-phosphate alpha-N-acetylglucosaminyl 1-phosphate transferase, partial [Candidatus Gottesmanbacteria bacterium]|nr:undecaprenyl/decaprenyl-phosphate alpha-N-acetylglucosaminyl 1-phosphate transferase [Candidatus Gottesmanbacteria bacterium]